MKIVLRLFLVSLLLVIGYLSLVNNSYAQETPTQDEQAMGNFTQGLLPKEAIRIEPSGDNNFLSLIKNSVTGFFGIIINKVTFTAQSESIHQSYLPNELKPESKAEKTPPPSTQVQGITITDPLEALKGFLGGSTGFYGASLPKEVQSPDIKGSEGAFEKAYFPEGIRPITGQ